MTCRSHICDAFCTSCRQLYRRVSNPETITHCLWNMGVGPCETCNFRSFLGLLSFLSCLELKSFTFPLAGETFQFTVLDFTMCPSWLMLQGVDIPWTLLSQPALLILKVVGGVEDNSSDSKPMSISVLLLSLDNATGICKSRWNGSPKKKYFFGN